MNIYIQTDIEGVAGVTFFENRSDPSIENHAHRQRMRWLLTGEVNAAAKAAFDAGAELVVINDSHGSAYNIFFEDLDSRCEILHGRGGSMPFWLQDIKGDHLVDVFQRAVTAFPWNKFNLKHVDGFQHP